MRLFTFSAPSEQPAQAVVLLGTGLVGGAIADLLRVRNPTSFESWETPWNNPDLFADHLCFLVNRISTQSMTQLDWIWAAGKAGFPADSQQVQRELLLFERFLDAVVDNQPPLHRPSVRLHLISSAGGIFEGQSLVGLHAQPSPCRPYGQLKLQQEQLAARRLEPASLFIYRLSSVYGLIRPGRRMGLISVLLSHAIRQQTTIFHGQFDTLRDYLWAEDAARFIVDRVLSRDNYGPKSYLLASARPTSIFEARTLAQQITHRKIYVQCLGQPANARSITFSPAILPVGWCASDLSINMKRVFLDAMCSGKIKP